MCLQMPWRLPELRHPQVHCLATKLDVIFLHFTEHHDFWYHFVTRTRHLKWRRMFTVPHDDYKWRYTFVCCNIWQSICWYIWCTMYYYYDIIFSLWNMFAIRIDTFNPHFFLVVRAMNHILAHCNLFTFLCSLLKVYARQHTMGIIMSKLYR